MQDHIQVPGTIEQPSGPPLTDLTVPQDDIDERRRQVYVAHEEYLRTRLHALAGKRHSHWSRDYSSEAAYLASIGPMRTRFKHMLGCWLEPGDRPTPIRQDLETLGTVDDIAVTRFRVDVVPGLWTYGCELTPKTAEPRPGLVVQHGYDGTPEAVCGLIEEPNEADYSYRSLGLRAASRGYHVIAVHHPSGPGVPDKQLPGITPPAMPPQETNGQNRIDRLARLLGGTALGLFMLTTSRAVDLLMATPSVDSSRLGLYGLSQGGQTALLLPAMDTRIRASVSSAFFNDRLKKLMGPIPRSIAYIDWGDQAQFLPDQIRWFSDADIVSLIAPRAFAVECGRLDSAVTWECALDEFARARVHYARLGMPERCQFILHKEGHVSATRQAFEFLNDALGTDAPPSSPRMKAGRAKGI